MIAILTYQDLLLVPDNDRERAEFVRKVISEHESSQLYQTAKTADEYLHNENTTIMRYQKTINTLTGQKVVDRWSANHKMASNFFYIFVTQLNQYLLSNGVSWRNEETKNRLGADFDTRLQGAGTAALSGGLAFGFWNMDHLEVFQPYSRDNGNFAPLYDEENGALMMGVRSWRVEQSKPLRATLYELGGYTNYLWTTDDRYAPRDRKWQLIAPGCWMIPKQAYKIRTRESLADGVEIYAGENYPAFPIVPFWGNQLHQSELVGKREKIDAYDLILNGYENDLDNAQIYWIIKGAGGMDDPDLLQFLDRLRTVGATAPADGQEVDPVPVEIPYEARCRLLEVLDKRLYKDAMIMNPEDIAAGAATATQIRAAYEQQDIKANDFEFCVIDFIQGILKVAGIDDTPTFTRSKIVNVAEDVQTIVQAAQHLSGDYVTRKILTLLGDGDKADEVLAEMDAESMERLGGAADDERGNEGNDGSDVGNADDNPEEGS